MLLISLLILLGVNFDRGSCVLDYVSGSNIVGPSISGACPLGYIDAIVDGVRQCTSLDCLDNDPNNCPLYFQNGFCRSNLYTADQKQQFCAQTCGSCSPCIDVDPNCPVYASNGFCDDNAYTETQKFEKCKKSCNFCQA